MQFGKLLFLFFSIVKEGMRGVDPEYWEALPEDLRAEHLEAAREEASSPDAKRIRERISA